MKTIIFYRDTRGIGDAVMLLRTIELCREKNTEAKIIVVMDRPASAVLEQHSAIDGIVSTERFDISLYDDVRFYNLSSCCLEYEKECMWRGKKVGINRSAIFADVCDIEYDGTCGIIQFTDLEVEHVYYSIVRGLRERPDDKLVGIVWRSERVWSSYPHIELLVEYFHRKKGYVPVVIDDEKTFEDDVYSTADLDFRETVVLTSFLDIVIGPDTGPMHIAASYGVPTVWLFGPTDPRIRLKDYENAEYMWKPCDKDNPCWYNYCDTVDCMFNISPWSIGRKSIKVLKDDTIRCDDSKRESRFRRHTNVNSRSERNSEEIPNEVNLFIKEDRASATEE